MKTLKQLRTEKHITQEELAEIFNVSSRTIQNMEKDSSNIRDELLSKYIKAFDVKYDDIFLGTEYENFEFNSNTKNTILIDIKKKLQSA